MKELNLRVGQVIKNYIELCGLLVVEPTFGKGREYHIKELQRYCRYHKKGHAFHIDYLFEEPLPKIDGRKNNGGNISHTSYGLLMDDLIIEMVSNYVIEGMSFSAIFTECIPIFNNGYKEFYITGHNAYAKKYFISKGLTMLYSQKLYNVVVKCFESSLKRLQNKGIIVWSKEIEINDIKGKYFADEKLKKEIKDYENEVLSEMGIGHFKRNNPKTNKEFKRKVCKRIGGNTVSYWNSYSIDLVNVSTEYNITPNISELIGRFLLSIHRSIEKKECVDEKGKKFYPYQSEVHKKSAYMLDRSIWNLPKDYYKYFLKDYDLIYEDVLLEKECIPF